MPATRCHTAEFSEYPRIREEMIAEQAELYWLVRGCPEGSAEVDWLKAESKVDQEFLSQIELGIRRSE